MFGRYVNAFLQLDLARFATYPCHLCAGGLIGGFFATNLGRSTVFGIEGWRCAFHLVALVSIVTSVMTMWLAVDPRKKLAVSHLMATGCSHRLLISPGGAGLHSDQRHDDVDSCESTKEASGEKP